MDLGLKGKKAIVTGATRGIGRAIAETLAAEGCHVGICARTAEDVEAAVAALGEKDVSVCGAAFDVGDGAALADWVRDAAAHLGGLDIVVSNVSAMAIPPTEDAWRQDFTIDVLGAVRLVDAALPYLEKSDAGSIVIVSSVSGTQVDMAGGPYGAMKAALIHYAGTLSRQLAAKGIRANAIAPGTIYFDGGVWQRHERENPERFKAALENNPMGRMGTAEEVARAAVFLASPAASFVTGTNLVVDGALSTRVQF